MNPRHHQEGKEERKGWVSKAEEFKNFKKGRTEESTDLELRENGKLDQKRTMTRKEEEEEAAEEEWQSRIAHLSFLRKGQGRTWWAHQNEDEDEDGDGDENYSRRVRGDAMCNNMCNNSGKRVLALSGGMPSARFLRLPPNWRRHHNTSGGRKAKNQKMVEWGEKEKVEVRSWGKQAVRPTQGISSFGLKSSHKHMATQSNHLSASRRHPSASATWFQPHILITCQQLKPY